MSHYESHNLEDRALPFIYKERSVQPSGGRFGASNWHENVEILYFVSGDGAVSVSGRVREVRAGDLAVVSANLLHALAAGEAPLVHRYLIVDRAFCLANGLDTGAVTFPSSVDDDRLRALMEDLHAAYLLPQEDPYRILTVRSLVLQVMVLLCRSYGTPTPSAEHTDRGAAYVKAAIDFIRASYAQNFSLDEVAAYVGIHKCYLSREFHKYTGYPFVAYVNLTRCRMAQNLLADKRLSISEIGQQCGFESRSYFARSFRRYVGMLPSEWRERREEGRPRE